MNRQARADVPMLRQETQYTCCATSIAACLQALGKGQTEQDVNKVLNAGPMRGASWEAMLATVQYFGLRGSLVVPCTVEMLKSWTDKKIPIVIGWNPRNRPWSHASVVLDVTGDPGARMVHIMDPNLPNPSKSELILSEDDFYAKWMEPIGDNLIVRRPAMAVEREVSVGGFQLRASRHATQGEISMSQRLAAQDRSALIKLASGLKSGSPERVAILAGLTKQSNSEVNIPGKHILDNAEVYGNAAVYGNAKVKDKATVTENAKVYGNAEVYDKALIYGDNAQVYDYAKVWGGAEVYGNAHVYGGAKVSGRAHVYGGAHVTGRAHVTGKADISGTAVIVGGRWDGSEGPITSGRWRAPGDPA